MRIRLLIGSVIIAAGLWLGGADSSAARDSNLATPCDCLDLSQLRRRSEEAQVAVREWHGIQEELSRTRSWESPTMLAPVYYDGYQAKVQIALDNAVYRNAPLSLVAIPGQRGPAATLPDCSIVVTNSATPCLAELLTARERIHAATCERLKGIFDIFTSWLEYLTVEEWAQLEIDSYEHELFFIEVELGRLVPTCEPSFLPVNFSPHPVQELMLDERLLRELSIER